MAPTKKSDADRIHEVNQLIDTILADPELGMKMGRRGIRTDLLTQGKVLCRQAEQALRDVNATYSDFLSSEIQMKQAERKVREGHRCFARVLRRSLKGKPALLSELRLNLPTPRNRDLFVFAAAALFEQAFHRSEIMEELIGKGVSLEQICLERIRFVELAASESEYIYCRNQMKQATFRLKSLKHDLERWRRDCLKAARAAFSGAPSSVRRKLLLD